MSAQIERATFTTSRLMDFFSEKELTAQTGHARPWWPLVIAKELVDNALDACEEAGIAPEVEITVDEAGITVADNGPGIPPETVAGVLDYTVRVSSREAYVAPDRGAQGNALKTIVAMPFVLDGTQGRLAVTARGIRHEITVQVDPIRQQPVIDHEQQPVGVRTGTRITVHWPDSASSTLDKTRDRFLHLCWDYVWLNPHLRLRLDWRGEDCEWKPTDTGWEKWRPSEPTSPHWYQAENLERLVAAHLGDDRYAGMGVRDLVAQFRGLSGSAKQKQVLDLAGMQRAPLAGLVSDGQLDSASIERLLKAMQGHSRPVKPARLGVIGKDHLAARFAEQGCEMDSFEYRKAVGESGGLPWVVEVAFAWRPDWGARKLLTGVNWSAALGNPFRTIAGSPLDGLLERQRADSDCIVAIHVACPRVSYTDRGKSAVALESIEMANAVVDGLESVTRKWAKQRKAEERSANARLRRRDTMTRNEKMSIKDAAWQVMEAAYLKASGDGRFYANARQVMYAARPEIMKLTGGRIWKRDSSFTQGYLPDYIAEHGVSWRIAYDARGNLVEPHRDRLSGGAISIPLGTLEVRRYQAAEPDDPLEIYDLPDDFPTAGPEYRYSAVVFVEKEGFDQQITQSGLADKYDVAFMSTKGMSVTAARELIDHLASHGVLVLVVRDFDRAGFSIAGTLTSDSRRYRFHNQVTMTDLGLRLEDVEQYGLESEPWIEKASPASVKRTLRRHGATDEEIDFLVTSHLDWAQFTEGNRVELNAFTTEQFIEWLDDKLAEHVEKVIPDGDILAVQFRRAVARQKVNKRIDEIRDQTRRDADEATIPDDLEQRVRELLGEDSSLSWDEAITQIVDDDDSEEATDV